MFSVSLICTLLTLAVPMAPQVGVWHTVTPSDGRFHVSVPGEATERTMATDAGAGPLVTHTLSATGVGLDVVVSWTAYQASAPAALVPSSLDRAVEAIVAAKRGRVIERSDAPVDGRAARTVTFVEPDERVSTVRFVATGHCFYQLMASARNASDLPASERFFKSFEPTA